MTPHFDGRDTAGSLGRVFDAILRAGTVRRPINPPIAFGPRSIAAIADLRRVMDRSADRHMTGDSRAASWSSGHFSARAGMAEGDRPGAISYELRYQGCLVLSATVLPGGRPVGEVGFVGGWWEAELRNAALATSLVQQPATRYVHRRNAVVFAVISGGRS